jgi:hypothetical protein
MTQTYLLLARERTRLQQQREGYGTSAPTVGKSSTAWGHQCAKIPISRKRSMERGRRSHHHVCERYLEEVRRRAWRRGGKINTRAMEGGTLQNRKASLEGKNPRTMRRNTVPGLGEKLADRTQQRIVRRAAWDCCRFYDGRSTCRVFLDGAGGGCHCRIYGHLPAVRYSKGKLSNDGE